MKTNRLIPTLLIATVLLAPPLHAQQRRRQDRPDRGAERIELPKRVTPAPQKPALPELPPVPGDAEAAPANPAKNASPVEAPSSPAKEATAVALKEPPAPVKGGIMLNFQGTPIMDVLSYLSEAAGFIIVQDTPPTGTINVVSKQPVTPDEAVDLLNTVLATKGYTSIRNDRILKIVKIKDAKTLAVPVRSGRESRDIPPRDEVVTQILPLRYGEAGKLIENLRPLLPDNTTISANEASNSIIMTDTMTNIRRVAQIIEAIDTSVASISTIQVYQLQFADAKELASIVTQLFSPTTSGQGGRGGRGGGGGGPGGFFSGMFGGPGGPGGPGGGQAPQSEAKQAESRVVAVADEQSNSLVVSASDALIPYITEVVAKLDTDVSEFTETRIVQLQHADAVETASILTTLYGDTTSSSSNRGQNGGFGNRGGFPFGPGQFGGNNTSTQKSTRAQQQSKVVAVGNPRTNSLLIAAARETMFNIIETIGRLDATDAKKQRVFHYRLTSADPVAVANVLRGILGDQTALQDATRSGGASRLNERTNTGATMDTSEFSTTSGGRGTGR